MNESNNYDDDDDDDDNNNNNNNPQVSYYHIFILLKTEMKLLNMVIFHINRPFNDNIPTIFEQEDYIGPHLSKYVYVKDPSGIKS